MGQREGEADWAGSAVGMVLSSVVAGAEATPLSPGHGTSCPCPAERL